MKAILLSIILLLTIITTSIAGSGLAECNNIMEQRLVAPGVMHVFIDRTCDMIPDIVMEYRMTYQGWIYTGRWWWL